MMFVCLVHAWFLSNIWGNILTCISRKIIEGDKKKNILFLWCPLFLFFFALAVTLYSWVALANSIFALACMKCTYILLLH